MYTYAFVRSPETLQLPQGMTGDLQVIDVDSLAAVVEPGLDTHELRQNDERLMQSILWHDQVIQELFRQTVVLPLRFGTQFVSAEKLRLHLQENAVSYATKLDGLAGQAEYTLKWVPLEDAEPVVRPEGSGRNYFLAKKQQMQSQLERQEQQRQELEKVWGAIAQAYPHFLAGDAHDGIERLHLLVPQSARDSLREDVQRWQQQSPHWQLSLSEALPPYHFV